MSATEQAIELARTAAKAAADKLAENIVAVDVSERLAITDIFVIASAESERQVNAVVDNVEDELMVQLDRRPVRREGRSEGRWVLLDFGDVVVHVMHDEDRAFYALERLWKDCPVIDLGLDGAGASASAAG
ncbi:ribosome silencing factor [Sinomonas sp. ASV486]|uniref:Ribosomal silencing factor RsfS n=1 Tax=Sinomonas puerhi TaxID=3238584 RepID=A0AB39KYI0_9MICC|nr:ribosome silencing factor [Sinomonas sp. ASV486]MDQ4492332.1 ribosome silencing factor [Sinomonas sp. ASV486]